MPAAEPMISTTAPTIDDDQQHKSPEFWAQTLKKSSYANPEQYYDKMAVDYTNSVSTWGYTMPSECATTLARLLEKNKVLRILDLACGDGLVAEAFAKIDNVIVVRGEQHAGTITENKLHLSLTGADISQKMLELSGAKNLYEKLYKKDLSLPLAFESKFDAITCVGSTTYLTASQVLRDWVGDLCGIYLPYVSSVAGSIR